MRENIRIGDLVCYKQLASNIYDIDSKAIVLDKYGPFLKVWWIKENYIDNIYYTLLGKVK